MTRIADIQHRDDLILCQQSGEFEDLCDSVGLPRYNRQYTYGYAKIIDGEVVELWGYDGSIPYVDKTIERIYPSLDFSRYEEISHAYHAIGELCKTRRYPKQRETFIKRVSKWIDENSPNTSVADTHRKAVIAAFNFGWVNVACLIWNGIDRESLWLER